MCRLGRGRVEADVEPDRPGVHLGAQGVEVGRVGDQAAPLEVVENVLAHRVPPSGSHSLPHRPGPRATGLAQSHSPKARGSRVTRYVAQFIFVTRPSASRVTRSSSPCSRPATVRNRSGPTCSNRDDGLCSGSPSARASRRTLAHRERERAALGVPDAEEVGELRRHGGARAPRLRLDRVVLGDLVGERRRRSR